MTGISAGNPASLFRAQADLTSVSPAISPVTYPPSLTPQNRDRRDPAATPYVDLVGPVLQTFHRYRVLSPQYLDSYLDPVLPLCALATSGRSLGCTDDAFCRVAGIGLHKHHKLSS